MFPRTEKTNVYYAILNQTLNVNKTVKNFLRKIKKYVFENHIGGVKIILGIHYHFYIQHFIYTSEVVMDQQIRPGIIYREFPVSTRPVISRSTF